MDKPFFLNRALRVLIITNSIILLASALLGPIYAVFVEKVGGSLLDASWAGGIYAFVAGITVLFSGRMVDRVKESELIIVAGYTVMGFGFLSYVLVDSVSALFATQVLIGLGAAIYAPAFDALYSKHLDSHKSGVEWGAWESVTYLTVAIGAVLGGLVVTEFGFNALFATMAALSFGSALFIWRLPRRVL
ncbi:MAG: MFS transporter [Candidatus Colwellbacteria bacterium]|nr:MFS transporter [Candidatus Colwellbacteria bacterium]